MKAFSSLDDIRVADVETLALVPSMNRAAAEKVYEFFHKIKDTQGEEER
jgi:excinuclease ABC subunit C